MRGCIALIIFATGLLMPTGASAGSRLTEARALYEDAQYGPALTVLDELVTVAPTAELHQYRALCLLALERSDEAERAMDASVVADPYFRPDPGALSPRVTSMFTAARRRLLPATVRERFAAAMALHREGERVQASQRFGDLLRLLQDPALKDEQSLTDLSLAAAAFVELQRAQAVPAPLPVLPSTRVSLTALASSMPMMVTVEPEDLTPASPSTPSSAIVSLAAAPFTPPVALSQELPKWSPPNDATAGRTFVGAIAVVIDEQGRVVMATKKRTIHPAYDPVVLEAARGWSYMPAFLDGVPVRSELTVEVQLNPSTR